MVLKCRRWCLSRTCWRWVWEGACCSCWRVDECASTEGRTALVSFLALESRARKTAPCSILHDQNFIASGSTTAADETVKFQSAGAVGCRGLMAWSGCTLSGSGHGGRNRFGGTDPLLAVYSDAAVVPVHVRTSGDWIPWPGCRVDKSGGDGLGRAGENPKRSKALLCDREWPVTTWGLRGHRLRP